MFAIIEDYKAVFKRDPAARTPLGFLEVLLLYSGFHAIFWHRVNHFLHAALHIPLIPRFISQVIRWVTGVEIHPGAKIGPGFFIDHGMATVIGETAEIGKNCVLFHNVTLGGTGKHRGKRHPTLGDNVYVGTGATILGPVKIGDNAKIGAEAVVIMRDVPPNATVVGAPGKIIKLNGQKVDIELPKTEAENQ